MKAWPLQFIARTLGSGRCGYLRNRGVSFQVRSSPDRQGGLMAAQFVMLVVFMVGALMLLLFSAAVYCSRE